MYAEFANHTQGSLLINKDTQPHPKTQVFSSYSAYLADRVFLFVRSLLMELDLSIDRRLVETFLGLILVFITHRHRNHGLLLSELGGYLLPPEQAPLEQKDSTTCSAVKNGGSI